MDGKLKIQLAVNHTSVELSAWPEQFLGNMVICAATSLKHVAEIKRLDLHVEGDEVNLTVNETKVPLSPFPRAALAETFRGFISTLKGVTQINSFKIEMVPA